MRASQSQEPDLIGWKEYLDLPDLGIRRLKAKIDTGARTSALHVSSLEVISESSDGSLELEITVPLDRRGGRQVVTRVRALRRIQVTDSGGHAEIRPLIETRMRLGGVEKKISITLTDRGGMLFRMILGRKALEQDFVVDVAQKYVLSRKGT